MMMTTKRTRRRNPIVFTTTGLKPGQLIRPGTNWWPGSIFATKQSHIGCCVALFSV